MDHDAAVKPGPKDAPGLRGIMSMSDLVNIISSKKKKKNNIKQLSGFNISEHETLQIIINTIHISLFQQLFHILIGQELRLMLNTIIVSSECSSQKNQGLSPI